MVLRESEGALEGRSGASNQCPPSTWANMDPNTRGSTVPLYFHLDIEKTTKKLLPYCQLEVSLRVF